MDTEAKEPGDAGEAIARFAAAMEKAARRKRRVDFWWRDDDAVAPGPELDRLLALARTHGVPLALAVIPAEAKPALADRLSGEEAVFVLQHGWSHAQNNPPDQKKAEFGDHRPIDDMMAEIDAGAGKLRRLFGERFLTAFVPPWNRIGSELAARLTASRAVVISGYSPHAPSSPGHLDTHCDIIAWRTTRSAVPKADAFDRLAQEVSDRLTGVSAGPIGLLSHHLDHDEAAWTLLGDMLAAIGASPAARWPDPRALFAAPRPPGGHY